MSTQVQGYNSTTGVNALTAEQAEFYQDAMLERLLPELVLMKYGEKKNIPRHKGATTSFRRLNSLAVSTTALTEGVTPDGVNLDITKINTTVQEYGNWTKISEFINMTGLDPLMTEVAQLMGENAGESLETIVRDVTLGGTNVQYANNVASRAAVAGKITALDILRIRRTLKRNKVKKIKLPNGKSGYLGFIHTDVATDLMQTPEWQDANKYVKNDNLIEGTIGELYGIYFIEYDLAKKDAGAGASGVDVYENLFIGKGAFGVPDVEGSSKPQIIVHPAGSGGTSDPLNQFNTIAWKAALATIRLQELAMVRYECTATV